jgi:ribonuclease Z
MTHAHFDHVLGIPGLFSTLRLRRSADLMTIHGSPGTLDVVVRMLAGLWGEGKAPIPLELVPLAEGQVIDAGEFTIGCFPVRHRETDSYGFSFESRARRHLLPDRLEVLEVPDGPLRGELAQGKQVTLANGKLIDPEDVLGPQERGKKLVIVGDAETPKDWPNRFAARTYWLLRPRFSNAMHPSRATMDISLRPKPRSWRRRATSNSLS